MIVKSPQESNGRGQLPAVAVSRPSHISVAGAVAPTTQRDGSYASWGSCRRRAASSGHRDPQRVPGLTSGRGGPFMLVDQSAQ